MGKKIATLFLAIIMVCAVILPVALADAFYRGTIEHVDAVMPNIDVYFNIIDDSDTIVSVENITKDDVSAMLAGEALEVMETVPYAQTEKGTAYFFIVDISGSVASDFAAVKKSINTWVDNKKENDKIVLITFGKNVNVLLDGSETPDMIKQTVNSMQAKDKATKFFDGVYRALNVAKAENSDLPSRKVFLVVTDGQDYSTGGVTSEELSAAMIDSGIPMYNIAVSTSTGEDRSSLGELSRSTGAKLVLLQPGIIEPTFASLQQELNSGYMITLKAKSNKVDNQVKTLSIIIENDTIKLDDDVPVEINKHEEDTKAPDFEGIQVLNSNEIKVSFSEDVVGAENSANYSLTDENDEYILVDSVTFEDKEAKIVLSEAITNGDYTLTVSNIYDNSMEKNSMDSSSISFTASGLEDAGLLDGSDAQTYLIIGIAVLALILLVLIAAFMSKKNKVPVQSSPSNDFNPGVNDVNRPDSNLHVPMSNGKNITLSAISQDGVERNIKIVVEDSITIGRSTACDIYFDDTEMTRKHCIITNRNGVLYIKDDDSTNGTLLNGVPIGSETILNVGDVFSIGNYKIIYRD